MPSTRLISKAVAEYISASHTDFSIMITGEWGSGKTHYAKNEIRDIVTRSGMKFGYVSLYGIDDPKDIDGRVFNSVFPFRETNTYKLTKAVAEILLKRENIDVAVQQLNVSLENIVIVFDDFERINTDITGIFGVINNYSEHKHTKVILICDESKIKSEQRDQYETTKEKVVRFTLCYKADAEQAVSGIINESLSNFPEIYPILVRNKNYLEHVFILKGSNIRTLHAARESLRNAVGTLQTRIGLSHIDAFIDATLKCLVGYHCELSRGHSEELKKFVKQPPKPLELLFLKRNSEDIDSGSDIEYAENFYRDYFQGDNNPFVSQSSLTLSMYGVCDFDLIDDEYNLFVSERYNNDNKMSLLSDYTRMSNEDFDCAIDEWIYSLEHEEIYDIILLLRAVDYICFFIEKKIVSRISLVELKEISEKCLLHIIVNNPDNLVESFNNPLNFPNLRVQCSVAAQLKEIANDKLESVKVEVERQNAREAWENILNSYTDDIVFSIFGISSEWARKPLFSLIDDKEFVRSFDSAPSRFIFLFDRVIKDRYNTSQNCKELLRVEYEPLNNLYLYLRENLINPTGDSKRTLHMFACENLCESIEQVFNLIKLPIKDVQAPS
ncbi:MAG: P-loop NTPase fold protein [Acidithiobacillus ferrivorans]